MEDMYSIKNSKQVKEGKNRNLNGWDLSLWIDDHCRHIKLRIPLSYNPTYRRLLLIVLEMIKVLLRCNIQETESG